MVVYVEFTEGVSLDPGVGEGTAKFVLHCVCCDYHLRLLQWYMGRVCSVS